MRIQENEWLNNWAFDCEFTLIMFWLKDDLHENNENKNNAAKMRFIINYFL